MPASERQALQGIASRSMARQSLRAGPRDRLDEVNRALVVRSEERQVDVRLLDVRRLVLRLLCGFLQALHGNLVAAQFDTGVGFKGLQ